MSTFFTITIIATKMSVKMPMPAIGDVLSLASVGSAKQAGWVQFVSCV